MGTKRPAKQKKPQMDISITKGTAAVLRKTRRDVLEDEILTERFADIEMFGDEADFFDLGEIGNK